LQYVLLFVISYGSFYINFIGVLSFTDIIGGNLPRT